MTRSLQSRRENWNVAVLAETRALCLYIEGATPEDIKRGLEAAQSVFDKAQISAAKAYWAICEMISADDLGWTKEVPPEAAEHMHVWEQAEAAAIEACCAGWTSGKPERDVLELFPRPELWLS